MNIDKTDQNAARVNDQVAGIQTASRTEKAIVTLPGMIVVSTYYLCSWQMAKMGRVVLFFCMLKFLVLFRFYYLLLKAPAVALTHTEIEALKQMKTEHAEMLAGYRELLDFKKSILDSEGGVIAKLKKELKEKDEQILALQALVQKTDELGLPGRLAGIERSVANLKSWNASFDNIDKHAGDEAPGAWQEIARVDAVPGEANHGETMEERVSKVETKIIQLSRCVQGKFC